ncbi:hypothetical protein D3C81_457040 [compost metagenome]
MSRVRRWQAPLVRVRLRVTGAVQSAPQEPALRWAFCCALVASSPGDGLPLPTMWRKRCPAGVHPKRPLSVCADSVRLGFPIAFPYTFWIRFRPHPYTSPKEARCKESVSAMSASAATTRIPNASWIRLRSASCSSTRRPARTPSGRSCAPCSTTSARATPCWFTAWIASRATWMTFGAWCRG